MLTYPYDMNNHEPLLMSYFKSLLGKTMSLLTILITKMASLIVSRKMDIDISDEYKDSKEYFSSIWKEDLSFIKGEKNRLIFSLCLIYEAISLNFEFYWLRKTKTGIFLSKLLNRERCFDCS